MEEKAPRPGPGDAALSLARAAISAVPGVGGPGVELFNLILRPPLEKRRDAWLDGLAQRLAALEVDVARLGDNDAFVSAALQASAIAIRTHDQGKLRALQNAVANVAAGRVEDPDLVPAFLGLIDALSPYHLTIMAFLNDSGAAAEKAGVRIRDGGISSLSGLLEETIPQLRGQRETYDFVVTDLHSRGLIATDGLHTTMTSGGTRGSRTTPLGKRFLKFIADA